MLLLTFEIGVVTGVFWVVVVLELVFGCVLESGSDKILIGSVLFKLERSWRKKINQ